MPGRGRGGLPCQVRCLRPHGGPLGRTPSARRRHVSGLRARRTDPCREAEVPPAAVGEGIPGRLRAAGRPKGKPVRTRDDDLVERPGGTRLRRARNPPGRIELRPGSSALQQSPALVAAPLACKRRLLRACPAASARRPGLREHRHSPAGVPAPDGNTPPLPLASAEGGGPCPDCNGTRQLPASDAAPRECSPPPYRTF